MNVGSLEEIIDEKWVVYSSDHNALCAGDGTAALLKPASAGSTCKAWSSLSRLNCKSLYIGSAGSK